MEKRKKHNTVLILVLLVFLLFSLFLVFRVEMGISPDSYYHLRVSEAFSKTVGIPSNTPDTYKWRDITRIPYLYFWINARVLNINNGLINDVFLLRLVNVFYSFLSVYIFYLLSKEILKKEWMRVLAVFFLTNTLMFQFLSSSINYDNLGNLFCILSVYFFTKFVKSKINVKYLLYMLLFIGLGGITKYTTLPLSFILIILSGVEMYFRREEFKSIRKGKGLLLLIPVLILLCLNIGIYGVNLVRYGSLEPNCNQILTHEQCLENGVYYRDNIERPSINIGGISDIFTLIKTGKRIDPVRYLWYWSVNLVSKIYGIMGDSSLYMPKIFPYLFIGLFAVVVVVGILNRRKWDKTDIYLLLISLFYASILFFVQNYSMYLRKNHMYLALQGRYLFPVLPMIYILVSKSLSFIKNNRLRYILIGMFVLLFLYSNIPFFFLNVESWWFGVNF